MVFHLVLFRPRPELSESERSALVVAFDQVVKKIPQLRRAHVGRRMLVGTAYEGGMKEDYEYAAVLEFNDRSGLEGYLNHEAHRELGELFMRSFAAGLIYDYDMRPASAVHDLR